MRKIRAAVACLALIALAIACAPSPAKAPNPFFTEWKTPFGVPPFD